MASGDFNDLATRACYAAQRDPTDTTYDLARAKEAVNEAIVAVCNDGSPWDFLERDAEFSVTSSNDVYTYTSIESAISTTPHEIDEVVSITNDTDDIGPLVSLPWEELERLASSTQGGDATGSPAYFARFLRSLRFFPKPDQNYTLGALVRLRHGELSANGDTPLIPLAHRHAVLVPYAAAVLLRQDGGAESHSEAERYQSLHERAFVRLRTAHGTAKAPNLTIVGPSFGGDLPGSTRWWWP